jgi:hypothetical protein
MGNRDEKNESGSKEEMQQMQQQQNYALHSQVAVYGAYIDPNYIHMNMQPGYGYHSFQYGGYS